MKKQRPFGKQVGITAIVVALVFLIVNYFMYRSGRVFSAMLVITPMLFFGGITLLILHDTDPVPEIPARERPKSWWKNSPLNNRVVWILSMLSGLLLGFLLLFKHADLLS